jgi:hypothetical protein
MERKMMLRLKTLAEQTEPAVVPLAS